MSTTPSLTTSTAGSLSSASSASVSSGPQSSQSVDPNAPPPLSAGSGTGSSSRPGGGQPSASSQDGFSVLASGTPSTTGTHPTRQLKATPAAPFASRNVSVKPGSAPVGSSRAPAASPAGSHLHQGSRVPQATRRGQPLSQKPGVVNPSLLHTANQLPSVSPSPASLHHSASFRSDESDPEEGSLRAAFASRPAAHQDRSDTTSSQQSGGAAHSIMLGAPASDFDPLLPKSFWQVISSKWGSGPARREAETRALLAVAKDTELRKDYHARLFLLTAELNGMSPVVKVLGAVAIVSAAAAVICFTCFLFVDTTPVEILFLSIALGSLWGASSATGVLLHRNRKATQDNYRIQSEMLRTQGEFEQRDVQVLVMAQQMQNLEAENTKLLAETQWLKQQTRRLPPPRSAPVAWQRHGEDSAGEDEREGGGTPPMFEALHRMQPSASSAIPAWSTMGPMRPSAHASGSAAAPTSEHVTSMTSQPAPHEQEKSEKMEERKE